MQQTITKNINILLLLFLAFTKVQTRFINQKQVGVRGDFTVYVSIGTSQATYFTTQTSGSNKFKVTLHDFENDEKQVLKNEVNLKSEVIISPSCRGCKNTLSENYYMIQHPNGSILSDSFSTTKRSWSNTASVLKFRSCFSYIPDYYHLSRQNNGSEYWMFYFQESDYQMTQFRGDNSYILEMSYEMSKQYKMDSFQNSGSPCTRISILTNPLGAPTWKQYNDINPLQVLWATSELYYALYSKNQIRLFNMANNYNQVKRIDVLFLGAINQIALTSKYLLVSNNSFIFQFELETGDLLTSFSIPYSASNVTINTIKELNKVILWKYGQDWIKVYNLDNSYDCDNLNGCICKIGFCFDSQKTYCYEYSGDCPVEQTVIIPNTSIINPPQTFPIVLYFFQSCFLQQTLYCQVFCSRECAECQDYYKNCVKCAEFYERNENGECVISVKAQLILAIAISVNVVRMGSIQNIFCLFFFDGIQLYNFHQIQYQGLFSEILDIVDLVEERIWAILPLSSVLTFVSDPLPLPTYYAYTNLKFSEKTRRDSIFWQNSKIFWLIFLPFTLLFFFLLNKIFWLVSGFQLSSYIRIFSFWLQFGVILCVQNMMTLGYYFMQNMLTFFNLSPMMKLLNCLSLFLFGCFLMFAFSFLHLSKYFYANLHRYFLNNCKPSHCSLFYSLLKHILKPLIDCFIHLLLINHPKTQLLLLSLTCLISFCFSLLMELSYNLSTSKLLFTFTCLLELFLAIFNMLLFLQYCYWPKVQFGLEESQKVIIYCFMGTLIMTFVYPFVYEIARLISKRRLVKKVKHITPISDEMYELQMNVFGSRKRKN